MDREELLKSKEYWLIKIQNDLFANVENYMQKNSLNRTKLADKLGVTKGYITQLLNGDFDNKISKLVELSLACNVVPLLNFVDADQYIRDEEQNKPYQLMALVSIPVQFTKNKSSYTPVKYQPNSSKGESINISLNLV